MTKQVFIHLCNTLGNPDLAEGDRWRSMKFIHSDSIPVFDFQNLYKKGKAYYVTKTLDDGAELNGFIIIDDNAAEFGPIDGDDHVITFIDLNCVYSVSFLEKTQYPYAVIAAKDINASTPDPTIKFDNELYHITELKEMTTVIHASCSDPIAVSQYVYNTQAKCTAATKTAPGEFIDIKTMKRGNTYYVKAFANDPFNSTATCTVSFDLA